MTIQNSLYQYFGAPGPGAFITVGAVLCVIALTVLMRKRRPAFWWTLAGTLCLAIAFPLIYFLRIEPVLRIALQAGRWLQPNLPPNWAKNLQADPHAGTSSGWSAHYLCGR